MMHFILSCKIERIRQLQQHIVEQQNNNKIGIFNNKSQAKIYIHAYLNIQLQNQMVLFTMLKSKSESLDCPG